MRTTLSIALVCTGIVTASGCIGGRFAAKTPEPVIDPRARVIVDRINADRASKHLPPGSWVPELVSPATRAATAVARGDQSLVSAAHLAAQGGVTELGRHVWSFATDCADPQQFKAPPMTTEQKTLLFAAAAVPAPAPAGHTTVMLLIAETGTSALRAEQMGGGRGGSNPTLETYIHSSVATGPCGQAWPAAPRVPL